MFNIVPSTPLSNDFQALNSFLTEGSIMETSPLICSSRQCTDFYKIGIFVIEELNEYKVFSKFNPFCSNVHRYFNDLYYYIILLLNIGIFPFYTPWNYNQKFLSVFKGFCVRTLIRNRLKIVSNTNEILALDFLLLISLW